MKHKKHTKKKKYKDSIPAITSDLMVTGITLGLGSTIVDKIGAPVGVSSAFTTVGEFMPALTTIRMGGLVLDSAQNLNKSSKKKKKGYLE